MSIDTIITDFDNTLFDWVGTWHHAYSGLLRHLKDEGVDVEAFKTQTRSVQQSVGTSEYVFLLDEIPVTSRWSLDRRSKAAHVWKQGIEEALKPYPGVVETLAALKGRGVQVVVHTDSMAGYSRWRLDRLGLTDHVDQLICPKTHQIPDLKEPVPLVELAEPCEKTHLLARHQTKPCPQLVRDVLTIAQADPGRTLYIGDSLARDVSPANEVGIRTVHAQYGDNLCLDQLELLRSVTHWTDEKIEMEKSADPPNEIFPWVAIDAFDEILTIMEKES